jgi:hypothetical protein
MASAARNLSLMVKGVHVRKKANCRSSPFDADSGSICDKCHVMQEQSVGSRNALISRSVDVGDFRDLRQWLSFHLEVLAAFAFFSGATDPAEGAPGAKSLPVESIHRDDPEGY